MKKSTSLIVFAFALLVVAANPVFALEPFALYDDFTGDQIDPAKWVQVGNPAPALEIVRRSGGNNLHLLSRTHGDTGSDVGRTQSSVRVGFINPNAVTAIKARAKVRDFEVSGCNTNSASGRVRGPRISGFFFHTDAFDFVDGAVGDVLAAIEVRRETTSNDPPLLRAFVFLCLDSDCNAVDTLASADLGTIAVGEPTMLTLQWFPEANGFLVERDNQGLIYLPYEVSNVGPPIVAQKRLGVTARAPNCTSSPRPVSFIDVVFQKVFVNASAVLP